jgi:excinuclease ABC subunit B
MYADTITLSMKKAISETNRRRRLQGKFNREHGITPETIKKSVHNVLGSIFEADYYTVSMAGEDGKDYVTPADIPKRVKKLQREMRAAAKELDFERAAELRDEIIRLEAVELKAR